MPEPEPEPQPEPETRLESKPEITECLSVLCHVHKTGTRFEGGTDNGYRTLGGRWCTCKRYCLAFPPVSMHNPASVSPEPLGLCYYVANYKAIHFIPAMVRWAAVPFGPLTHSHSQVVFCPLLLLVQQVR